MNQRALIAAAAATVLSSMLVAVPAAAQEKEKCFGIAKMGQNDCANLSGSHSCAGQSKMDMGADEWKYVVKKEKLANGEKNECEKLGGTTKKPATVADSTKY